MIIKSILHITCNRLNNCSYSSSIWDYIQQIDNLSNRDTLIELAKLAGVNLPESHYNEEKYTEVREVSNILEKSLSYMKSLLFLEQGKPVLKYLNSRGYTQEEIKNIELGYGTENYINLI